MSAYKDNCTYVNIFKIKEKQLLHTSIICQMPNNSHTHIIVLHQMVFKDYKLMMM